MVSWLARRRARIARIDTEAEALIRGFGDRAYSEARRREREASSEAIVKDWSRVALAVAGKTGKRVGLDTATRMATDADFSLKQDWTEPPHQPPDETDPLDELMRIISASPSTEYRLQFLGAGTDRGPSILKEVELRLQPVRGCPRGGAPALAAPRDRLPADRRRRPGGLRVGQGAPTLAAAAHLWRWREYKRPAPEDR